MTGEVLKCEYQDLKTLFYIAEARLKKKSLTLTSVLYDDDVQMDR